ncbi:hypothetical protein SAMN05444484_104461 [Flavobacterium chilense]|uniref:Uncharacterized protein n=1 Tax=Flavobacterium chilense TaxID=946677 RepID=A0A1M7H475_9FLAO|nr:hypothetical protein SAMN05444484_104461 [Flavobacterium chilense]
MFFVLADEERVVIVFYLGILTFVILEGRLIKGIKKTP